MLLTGCPSIFNTKPTPDKLSADELYENAQESFDKKKYTEAVRLFEQLKSAHPDFEKITTVYQRIADAYFKNDEYDEAVSSYRQFLELYPHHDDRARALYMVAMCYFNQITRTDLDNSMVKNALRAFKEVVRESDPGQWKEKAEKKIKDCRTKLAEKELYKARTYKQIKRYKAARMSAKRVLDEYAGLGLDDEAKQLIKSIKGR